MLSKASIKKQTKKGNTLSKISQEKIFESAAWIRFNREMKIDKIFFSLPDNRQKGKVKYKISSLVSWALHTCVFRIGSKNGMQTAIKKLDKCQSMGVRSLLEVKGETVPDSSTVDNLLKSLSYEAINKIPLVLVKDLERKKFFYNHTNLLINGGFAIGVDGFHVHSYNKLHATDKEGKNICPHCLERVHSKNGEKESKTFVHIVITFTLILNGIVLPLYNYVLKSNQIDASQSSEEKFKQECELTAAKAVLPILRAQFPKIPLLFLGDALYANRPMIKLLEELKMDYMIVLKENTLRKLNASCDGLAKTDLYKKHYRGKEVTIVGQKQLEKEGHWFNHADVGEGVYTNVLRMSEKGSHLDGEEKHGYRGAWICSKKISEHNLVVYGKNRSYEMESRRYAQYDEESWVQ